MSSSKLTPVLNFIKLIPVLFSSLLLAAHFLRANMMPMVVVSLLFPLILLFPRAWAARAVQCILVVGSIEWLRTAYAIAARRELIGRSWTRMAVILGAVAAVTALSALILQCKSLKKRYGHGQLPQEPGPDDAGRE